MSAPTSSYSSDTAISALRDVLPAKIEAYGGSPVLSGSSLLRCGVAYNTPGTGYATETSADVAEAAAGMSKGNLVSKEFTCSKRWSQSLSL